MQKLLLLTLVFNTTLWLLLRNHRQTFILGEIKIQPEKNWESEKNWKKSKNSGLDSVIWMGLRGPDCLFWIVTQLTNYGKRPGGPEAEVEIVVPSEGAEWKRVKRFRRFKAAKGHQKLQTSVTSTYRITSNHVGLSFCDLVFGASSKSWGKIHGGSEVGSSFFDTFFIDWALHICRASWFYLS